jgi:methionine salvage enolase-phosphatase E1
VVGSAVFQHRRRRAENSVFSLVSRVRVMFVFSKSMYLTRLFTTHYTFTTLTLKSTQAAFKYVPWYIGLPMAGVLFVAYQIRQQMIARKSSQPDRP